MTISVNDTTMSLPGYQSCNTLKPSDSSAKVSLWAQDTAAFPTYECESDISPQRFSLRGGAGEFAILERECSAFSRSNCNERRWNTFSRDLDTQMTSRGRSARTCSDHIGNSCVML
ncbi:MAG: hypothetical protein ACI9S8_002538 [Chlamydiales bacterium]|jgi:hypothetical protein